MLSNAGTSCSRAWPADPCLSRAETGNRRKPQRREQTMQAAGDQNRVTEFFEVHSENYGDFFKEDTRTGASEMFRTRLAIAAGMLAGKPGALLDCATGTGAITQAVFVAGFFVL